MTNTLADYPQIAVGIAGRMRALVLTLDRLDRLEAGTGKWLEEFNKNELDQAATDMSLRALQASTKPKNYAILKKLSMQPSFSMKELTDTLKQDRLGMSERLNDLIQVGLVTREIDTDQAQITPSGTDMVRMISDLSSQAASQYQAKNE